MAPIDPSAGSFGAGGKSSSPLVSIISVNYGNARLLAECVALSIATLGDLGFEYLLVDNVSPDDSYEFLKTHFRNDPRVRVVQTARNGGFGSGCNYGARLARSPVLWFLNSDAWIVRLEGLTEALQYLTRPETGLIGTAVALHDGTRVPQSGGQLSFTYLALSSFRLGKLFRMLPAPVARAASSAGVFAPRPLRGYLNSFSHADKANIFVAGSAGGGSFLIGRQTFHLLHGFDENFFLYDEDADLCARAIDAGYRIYVHPKIAVRMFPSATTSKMPSLELKRIKKRSRVLLITKHFSGWRRQVLRIVTSITWRLL